MLRLADFLHPHFSRINRHYAAPKKYFCRKTYAQLYIDSSIISIVYICRFLSIGCRSICTKNSQKTVSKKVSITVLQTNTTYGKYDTIGLIRNRCPKQNRSRLQLIWRNISIFYIMFHSQYQTYGLQTPLIRHFSGPLIDLDQ